MEEETIILTLNRSALAVEPTDACLQWVKTIPENDADMTLDELLEDRSVYLIPEQDGNPEGWVKENYRRIFEEELEGWCSDPGLWPKDLSYEKFREFFKVAHFSIVLDLDEGPLEAN